VNFTKISNKFRKNLPDFLDDYLLENIKSFDRKKHLLRNDKLKETVSVISSDPPCKDGNNKYELDINNFNFEH